MADTGLSTMTIDMRSGESIAMAGVKIEFVHKSGRQARLRVTAPRHLPITKNLNTTDNDTSDSRAKHGFIEPA